MTDSAKFIKHPFGEGLCIARRAARRYEAADGSHEDKAFDVMHFEPPLYFNGFWQEALSGSQPCFGIGDGIRSEAFDVDSWKYSAFNLSGGP